VKLTFHLWGGVGLAANIVSLLFLFFSYIVGMGTYASVIALVWIGGMLYFGLGSFILVEDQSANIKITNEFPQ
jgi:hypothetical protein